jgi:TRAP-type C4-dicarboxylate transport system permease small subunit
MNQGAPIDSIRQKIVRNFLEYIVGIFFIALTIVTLLGVFFRYVLNDPLTWTEELGRYLMVWMTLFGATVGIKRGTHLKIDLNLFSFLPAQVAKIGRIFINFCIMGFLFVVTFKGVQYCIVVNAYISPVIKISMSYVWIVVPLNGFLMLVFLIRSTLVEIRKQI